MEIGVPYYVDHLKKINKKTANRFKFMLHGMIETKEKTI